MTQPFIGQIQPFGFNFPPRGWAFCNGQIMNIAQNTALFSLLGTYYGGNGTTTFALPNLQSRTPNHMGNNGSESFVIGEQGGSETVTLNVSNLPGHNHTFNGQNSAGGGGNPKAGGALANVGGPAESFYAPDTTPQPLNPASLAMTGGNQPHDNMQPYLVVNWCIATSGIYPSRN